MALLQGNDIGTNYKGILNLGTVGTPTAGINLPLTAVATGYKVVTDGEGNASPLQLATDDVLITSVLHVNANIFGSTVFATIFSGNTVKINNDYSIITAPSDGNMVLQNSTSTTFNRLMFGGSTSSFPALKRASATLEVRLADDSGYASFRSGNTTVGTLTSIAGTSNTVGSYALQTASLSIVPAAGSGTFRLSDLSYTINASGAQTGSTTGIFLNATETNLNGMTHNLMDLQNGGASRFRVSSIGQIFVSDAIYTGGGLRPTSGSNIILRDSGGTSFDRLQFGGTTSSFPALKRNTTNLEVKLADDSGYAGLLYKTVTATATPSAGAVTLNFNTADMFTVTLVNGTPTAITLSNARAGVYTVRLVQPAGGSATATWATTVVWSGGSAPILTPTANYSDIITLIYDGTTWRGAVTYNFAS